MDTELRALAPWLFETPEERALRVDREAQRLRMLYELKRSWREELEPAPCEAALTPVERPLRRAG